MSLHRQVIDDIVEGAADTEYYLPLPNGVNGTTSNSIILGIIKSLLPHPMAKAGFFGHDQQRFQRTP